MMLTRLGKNGSITVRELKAFLDKWPEDFTVSICGESDIAAHVDYDYSNIHLDDYDWMCEQFNINPDEE